MKILYLTASPQFVELPAHAGDEPEEREYPKLDLWPELKAVTDVLFDARTEGYVDLEVVPEVRREDLQRYLSRREVNVLHFSGHGDKTTTLSKEGQQSAGILFDDEFGYGELVPNNWLHDQLKDKHITVVVLNCCWSKAVADALKDTVDVIIGTTSPLMSNDAKRFSSTFYDALQRGRTLGEARDKTEEVIGSELYVFYPGREDPVWRDVVTPQAKEDVDVNQHKLLSLSKRFEKVRETYWENFSLDLVKVALGIAIAYAGYHYLKVAAGLDLEVPPGDFWGDLVNHIGKAVKDSQWLTFEPFAIVTAFAAGPVSRLLAAPLIYLVAPLAKLMFTSLSLRTQEYIDSEMKGERIQAISKWLKEFEQ